MRGRAVGVVKAWDARRGFGFIRVDDTRADVFVHREALLGRDALASGELVEFELALSARGPRATRVWRLLPECRKCGAGLGALRCGACGFLAGIV